MFRNILATSACAAALAACAALPKSEPMTLDDTALIPRADIFGNPERTQGRISPDGAYVSWLAPKDGVMNIFVAAADDPASARAVTSDTGRGINQHFWAPNGATIYYVQDQGGNENFHVYAVDVASGAVKDLTPVKEGARAAIQAVSRDRPDEILVGLNDRNPQLFDLYLVNAKTGERTLVKENPGFAGWLIDNTLTPRMGVLQTPDGGAKIVDFDGKERFAIPAEDFLTTNAIGFDGTNEAVYLVDSRGRDKAAFVRVSLADGAATTIAQSDKADISNVLLDPVSREPLAYSYEYLKTETKGLTPEATADLETLRKALPGQVEILSATDDLSKMVVYAEAAESPGAYYVYDRATKAVTKMFDTRPVLADAGLVPMQAIEIPSRDGKTLVSYLTLPPGADRDGDGKADARSPMVLAVHGGPWARDSYGYNAWHQWLANRGYAVLSVNYRGSTGFGKDFVNAAVGEFAGKMHDDLIDGVTWAVENGVADPEKVAIAGGSYGGYATLIGMTFTPETFACGVDIVGPSSLATLIESFPEYWKPFLEGTWYKYVGDPSVPEERADMLARSAISRIDAIQKPLLVGQGENDPRVTKLESDQLVGAMASKGLEVTYVNFPDEGHGFVRPENRLAFYSVMEGFLSQCLGGRVESIGDAFAGSSVQVLHGAGFVPGLEAAVAAHSPMAAEDASKPAE